MSFGERLVYVLAVVLILILAELLNKLPKD